MLDKLKGKNRLETCENCLMVALLLSACLFVVALGLTAWAPKGISALLTMAGAFTTFLCTAVLIFLWLTRELR